MIQVRFDLVQNLAHRGEDLCGFATFQLTALPSPGSVVNIRGKPYIILTGGAWAFEDSAEDDYTGEYHYTRVVPAFPWRARSSKLSG